MTIASGRCDVQKRSSVDKHRSLNASSHLQNQKWYPLSGWQTTNLTPFGTELTTIHWAHKTVYYPVYRRPSRHCSFYPQPAAEPIHSRCCSPIKWCYPLYAMGTSREPLLLLVAVLRRIFRREQTDLPFTVLLGLREYANRLTAALARRRCLSSALCRISTTKV